jgi:hypothetical protein
MVRLVSTSALFARLLDDAALFPPGNAPMPEALSAHNEHTSSWYASLVGPFLCPATRLGELRRTLSGGRTHPSGAPFGVSIVLDTGTAGLPHAAKVVRDDERLVLRGVELPLRGDDLGAAARRAALALRELEDDLATYVEVPRATGWQNALDVLAEEALAAKYRTGGESPDAVPRPDELAALILGCLDRELPFKCTAGLHHVVRHTDPATGQDQHGFGNLALAVRVALDGGSAGEVAATLAERDAPAIAARLGGLDSAAATSARRWFRSFGTCSVLEPVDDLVSLGLPTPEPVDA